MVPDYRQLFEDMHPGFFQRPYITALPESAVYEEMALELASFPPSALLPAPEGVSFGFYQGDHEALLRAVNEVEPDWAHLYPAGVRAYCAMAGDAVASFCIVDQMGQWQGMKIGGPGCVGTVPAFRKRGIGLKMVENVTRILRNEGCDLSYIHFTGPAAAFAELPGSRACFFAFSGKERENERKTQGFLIFCLTSISQWSMIVPGKRPCAISSVGRAPDS